MSSGLFGIGTSALNANQRALDTTGHNIANVNTEGYSRQRAELVSRGGQFSGAGYIGKGVDTSTVRRMYDQFLQTQLRNNTTAEAYYSTRHEYLGRVDNLLADPDAGLAPGLQDFFSAVQQVADDPTASADRTVLISEAESLVDRFRFLDRRLSEQQTVVNGQIGTAIEEVNAHAQSIARLNQQIIAAEGRGQPPNDLLDQRDQAVLELSRFVDVQIVEQDNGALNVFIGNGQGIVLGQKAQALADVSPQPGLPREVRFGGEDGMDVTRLITGGRLGGLLELRSSVLDEARGELGRAALGMAVAFNNQHQAGLDRNGEPGGAFFDVPTPEVLTATGTTADEPTVAIDRGNLAELTADDYRLSWDDGASEWQLRKEPDGSVLATAAGGGTINAAGLEITAPPAGSAGDSFVIRPTRDAASRIGVDITDPEKVAAAAAMLPTVPDGTEVESLSVVDPGDYQSWANWGGAAPGDIVFNQSDFSEMSEGVWRAERDGVEIIVRGSQPADGDVRIARNEAFGVGDNRNALGLSNVQSTQYLDDGSTSLEGAYNSLVGKVGTQTRQAEVAANAQAQLLADAQAQRDSVSGVNLDEEAANLMRYQQAYQASAQVISITNTLFDTLIGAVRR